MILKDKFVANCVMNAFDDYYEDKTGKSVTQLPVIDLVAELANYLQTANACYDTDDLQSAVSQTLAEVAYVYAGLYINKVK